MTIINKSKPGQNLHLNYLDGIRGLAALYVVLFHSGFYTLLGFEFVPKEIQRLINFTSYGHFAVVVFIVLSGYCLTLPIASSSNFWFKGGVKRYFKRRALRILPPYFSAIAVSLLFIMFLPNIQELSLQNVSWKHWLPAFTPDVLLSHFLLIHNLNENWIYKINDPSWTVATEWQLYFTLPLLIFLWKRFSLLSMVVISIFAGILVQIAFPQFSKACPWFLGCFAMGVAGSILNFSGTSFRERFISSTKLNLTWVQQLLICLCPGAFLVWVYPHIQSRYYVVGDTIVGLVVTTVLVFLTHSVYNSQGKEFSGIKRFNLLAILESNLAINLGKISYSLYLVHSPILNTIQFITHQYGMDIYSSLYCMFGVGIPISLGFAVVSYQFFELPMMLLRSKQ